MKIYRLWKCAIGCVGLMMAAMPWGFAAPSVATSGVGWQQLAVAAAGHAAILVEEGSGRVLLASHADEAMIPASILKVATSSCALDTLPANFRFPTAFYYSHKGSLYVKGYGDPAFVSEEMPRIVQALASRGIRQIHKIILDDTFFAPGIQIDGQSKSLNPYDAMNGALIANFNTIMVRKLPNGTVVSAEPQTPMTALTTELARALPRGAGRINLSRMPEQSVLYVGHLLRAFLQQGGIPVLAEIKRGKVPHQLQPTYIHYSSKLLADDLQNLLEFSNNFMINQIFLAMGAEKFGAPATVEKGVRVVTECMHRLGWKNFAIREGSGLSRDNRVTAIDMMRLLRSFEGRQNLLPIKEGLRAKTGTLQGVSSLIGYFQSPSNHHYRFVIIINDPHTTYEHKFKVAKIITAGLQ